MSAEQERQRLEERERFYATIVHSLGGIVWEANGLTFQFSFVSQQAEAILGYPVREWLDEPDFWRRHTHPDDVERCTAVCLDATIHGHDHSFEYRMIAADSRVVWLRDIVTVKKSPDGSVRLMGIMMDVTEHKLAEQERLSAEERATRSEERFRRLIEHSWDKIAVLDRAGTILFLSPAVQRMLGYSPGELEGRQVLELAEPGERPRVAAFFDEVFAARGAARDIEYRSRHKDGSTRVLQTFATAAQDDTGRDIAIFNTRDITDRKQLESRLLQAQKMEAIGVLAGGIAHDFNNLLTVIRGYAEMAHEEAQGAPLQRDLDEIRRACDRAIVLTQQLLAFSRKQVLHPQVIDLNATIDDIAKLLARLIGESIDLRIESKPAPPILVDPGQVEQVLMNLTVNARDAMPFGGTLTIETGTAVIKASDLQLALPGGRYAIVVLSDTGTGMSSEIQSRIFEPFFTTKEPGKGTGLGLSTAYGIMKQSGGHIEVRSETDLGTTFTLYFPETTGQVAARTSSSELPAARGLETVLLVEDEPMVRQLTLRVLQGNGYRVLTAASGVEALEVCRTHEAEIHLLITDVVMPGMSGPELAARLETIRPSTKVLYMSGYTGDAIMHHGIAEQGISFIQKPFTPQALSAKVREVVDGPL